MMTNKNRVSILMRYYMNQKANRSNKENNHFDDISSSVLRKSSRQVKTDVWSQEKQSNMEIDQQPTKKTNFVHICPPKSTAWFIGLIIGSLLASIGLAVVLTMFLHKGSTSASTSTASPHLVSTTTTIRTTTSTTTKTTTSTTSTSTTTTTTTTTETTTSTTSTSTTTTTTTTTETTTSTTSTSTTTQASATAYSTLPSYCGCSGFTLSIDNTSFNTLGAIYQWQSSTTGQNTWSNINTPSSTSTLPITSQVYSTDYQCQIMAVNPSLMNLTSTVVTVMATTNIDYCQTFFDDCTSYGDDIDDFILIGELGTQINDIATNCAAFSYDNRTQESVSLYQNTNYTAQVSTQYSGDEELVIWIDFNDNFQFESSEQVAYTAPINTTDTDVIVAIPSSSAGATVGIHRMRATLAFQATSNPCGTSSAYGETHDYTVNILSPPG